jgi:hypothetical protein
VIRLHRLNLSCASFWVDVRLLYANGRWLASADTPDGPSLGIGYMPEEALARALRPFEELIDELLATVPDDFQWERRASR